MSAGKRRVNPLTIQEKKAVILEVENSNGRTKSQIAEQFRIPKSTLSTILKEKERILNLTDTDEVGPQRKRMRARRGTHPQLEEALYAWLQQQATVNQTVTGQRMLLQTQELARQFGLDDFKCSGGWLDNFRRRHGLSAGPPPPPPPPPPLPPLPPLPPPPPPPGVLTVDGWRPEPTAAGVGCEVTLEQLPPLLDGYGSGDVFVVAEMGLVFDLTPAEAGVGADDSAVPQRRLSVLVAASADGEQKLPLLVAGQLALTGVSRPGRISYRAEPRARLRPADFATWLEQRAGELAAQGRRALFLCESQPLHSAAGSSSSSLESVQLARLPASQLTRDQLSSRLGVLRRLKRQFRRRVASWLAEHRRPPNADEAVTLLSRAWWTDVGAVQVRRFHAAAGLMQEDAEATAMDINGEGEDVGARELAALEGGPFAAGEHVSFDDFVTADDAVGWSADPPPVPPGLCGHGLLGERSPLANPDSPASEPVRSDRLDCHSSPDVVACRPDPAAACNPSPSPAAIPIQKGERSPGDRREATRRRPSSQEALRAVIVLQQYFQLRENEEDLDEVLSFVAFTREKIVKLQLQESNGAAKMKREVKSDQLDTIKFESPILSIDPDVNPPETLADSAGLKVPPPLPAKPAVDLLTKRKGGIRVGVQFQADVPVAPLGTAPDTSTDSSRLELPCWTTEHKLTDEQINQFVMLTRAVGMLARACDATSAGSMQGIHLAAASASRDVTRAHALDILYRHDFCLTAALSSLVPAGGPVLCRDELEDWSVHEAAIFEQALSRHGKKFDVICAECLPWKTSAQINEYYYMWKTTDRYVRRRRAKHLSRRQAALAAHSQTAAAAAAAARPASDALSVLSPMLNALGTSVSIEPVAAAAGGGGGSGARRSPEQRGRAAAAAAAAAAADRLCAGVRLSGECSITPVPLSR